MAATPSRIGFILKDYRRAIADTTAAKTRYGSLARQSQDPVPTYFDNVADAQVIANERQALLSPSRRRFKVQLTEAAQSLLPLNLVGSVPLARYADADRSANMTVLVSEIGIDLGRESATLTVWG